MTQQTILLAARQTLIQLQVQEMTSAVVLVEALGGGWDRVDLPGTVLPFSHFIFANPLNSLGAIRDASREPWTRQVAPRIDVFSAVT